MEDLSKTKWIKHLKTINNNWQDGDVNEGHKTADLVNDELKIAIEIKNDITSQLKTGVVNSFDLITLSNRYRKYGRDSNEKFSFYPSEYKTILLIESEMPYGVLNNIFAGITRIYKKEWKVIVRNRNFSESYTNIGCYIIKSCMKDTIPDYYYIDNPATDRNRVIEKAEVEKLLKISFCN